MPTVNDRHLIFAKIKYKAVIYEEVPFTVNPDTFAHVALTSFI